MEGCLKAEDILILEGARDPRPLGRCDPARVSSGMGGPSGGKIPDDCRPRSRPAKCPASLIPSNAQWEVRLNCRDLNLMPGTAYPNESGMVFGLHWEGWTNWDRSLDWSGRLLGPLPAANAHIVVEDLAGNRIWGDAP